MTQPADEWFYGVRLSPPPEEKVRKGLIRADPPVSDMILKSWGRENKRFIWDAVLKPVVLPNYSLAEHRRRIETEGYPKLHSKGWRNGDRIDLDPTVPSVVCDPDGEVAIWSIPGFLKPGSLGYLNLVTNEFIDYEMANSAGDVPRNPVGGTSNGKARAGLNTYTTDKGIYGTGTYCLAWHQQGHEKTHDFEPSRSLTQARSTKQVGQRDRFFNCHQSIDLKINDFIRKSHPKLHNILQSIRKPLTVHPTVERLLPSWHSDHLGKSFIVNRQSGEHFDKNGIPFGYDCLLAAGVFTGGEIDFADLGVRASLLPGTLLLFDGTVYCHSIREWQGKQRLSTAYFVHRSVFDQLEIDIKLGPVKIDELKARWAPPDSQVHPKAAGKRKRKGHGGKGYRGSDVACET